MSTPSDGWGSSQEGEESIDDALEAARSAPEDPVPADSEGVGIDRTRERGDEDATAAEQGNRDEDVMVDDGLPDDDDLAEQLAGDESGEGGESGAAGESPDGEIGPI